MQSRDRGQSEGGEGRPSKRGRKESIREEVSELGKLMYSFDEHGQLRHIETGSPFAFVDQDHYDRLGEAVLAEVQRRMHECLGMREVWVPVEGAPDRTRAKIFHTDDLFTKDKCMILVQGSGAVRPGQWARALCINDSLEKGSMLPVIERAIHEGYSVIVLNPNEHVEENETRSQHMLYMWDTFVAKAPAVKHVVLVAHSAGGVCPIALLKQREDEAMKKVRAVAFTDSAHTVSVKDPETLRSFLQDHCINWLASKEPLDTPLDDKEHTPCRSAGHAIHEYTTWSAFNSFFSFFQEKFDAIH